MEFIYIAPGHFEMGSKEGKKDETPTHSVQITTGFYLSKFEVTQAQWLKIMDSNPSVFNANRAGENHLNHPVERVSWNEIQQFIEKLSIAENGARYRLPTEAEWEYAAKGGMSSQNYTYAGSNQIDEVAWYDSGTGTQPVGMKSPNELGLYDMSGNVWEWCSDWYSSTYYTLSPMKDPKGPIKGSSKVLRGGSWLYGSIFSRVSDRYFANPSASLNYFGFRLVREEDPIK